jgi:hypothetical protein
VLGVGGGHHQPVVPIRPPAAQHRVGGLCNGPVGDRPEDALLVQFQGMIAEYEKAQIIERTRRGKAHRAKAGVVNVLWGAPYGYRYVRKSDHAEARYELVEPEASVARELFRRYTHEACSIADLARWLSEQQIPTRTGKARWDRSTVWGMLRNPAYAGRAAFSKTMRTEQRARLTRPARLQGRSVSANPLILDRPREDWVEIAVPPIVSEETFQLAARRLAHNQRFAARNAKVPSLLQGLAACQGCGYAYYRTSTRTTNKKLYYYRCLGSDDYRYPGGRVCANLPVRADYLDQVVWEHVTRLLADPPLGRWPTRCWRTRTCGGGDATLVCRVQPEPARGVAQQPPPPWRRSFRWRRPPRRAGRGPRLDRGAVPVAGSAGCPHPAGHLAALELPVRLVFGAADRYLNPDLAGQLVGLFQRADLHLVQGR